MAIKITPSVQEKIPEQDRKDGVLGQGTTQALDAPATLDVDLDLQVKDSRPTPQILLEDSGSVVAKRTPRTPDVVAIAKVNRAVADGALDPTELDGHLRAMAGKVYSVESQDSFIRYLEARQASPAELTKIARQVRHSTYKADMKLGRLRAYLAGRGVKLYGNEKLPEEASGVCMNLTAFRQKLKDVEKNGGVIDKRTARELIGSIKDVEDERDLMEAQWLLKRRVYEGKLRFAGTDEKAGTVDPYQERYFRLIDEKLGGQVNPKEISWLAREARKANFDDASMARLKEAIGRCKGNPDALFFAERVVTAQIRQAENALTRGPRKAERNIEFLRRKLANLTDPVEAEKIQTRIGELEASIPKMEAEAKPELARLERVNDDYMSFITPLVDGKLDRRTVRKDLIKQFRDGKIDERQVAGMMHACATSDSPEDFAYAAMLFHTQAAMTDTWEALAEAWEKMMEAFRQSMSDDTFDSNGNVIESAQERRWRKRVEKRVIQELDNANHQVKELAKRASLQSLSSQARQSLPQVKDGAERASLQTQETAFEDDAQGADLSQKPTV